MYKKISTLCLLFLVLFSFSAFGQGWYFKPDKPDTAPSGMPDFDQYQNLAWMNGYCGPTAVANCLWWFGVGLKLGYTPPQLIDTLAYYFQTDPNLGTNVHMMEAGLDSLFKNHNLPYYETTFQKPNFREMEDSLKKCQDIILLLGFWFEDPIGSGIWYRCGGHFVTMAGVYSESLKVALSDPARDAAENGWPGRVRPAHIPHPNDHLLHNNPAYVSQDIYNSSLESPSPGNPGWDLWDYPAYADPRFPYDFCYKNIPPEFQNVTRMYPADRPWFAEVEYAVMICPKPDTDFTIDAIPDTQQVIQGNSTTYNVTVTSINGFGSAVTLSVAGLPTGATASFVPNPVIPTGTSAMTVNTATTTPVGTYTLTVTGTGGGKTHSTNVVLIVKSAPTSCWYWKADNQYAPSGMPDFDQWQMQTPYYCGPTAVANCLWWFGVGTQLGYAPPQLIDTLSLYFRTNHSTPPFYGTDVRLMEDGLIEFWKSKGIYRLYETTWRMPNFFEMEDSLKVSQDIILLLGFWWWDGQNWWRCGGHYVTMAGVCSDSLKIAISDPGRDAAENGWAGRVRPPHPPHPGDPILHNDPTFVSHDIYNSILESPTPGNPFWALIDYPYYPDPRFPMEYCYQNVPEEFREVTRPYPGEAPWFAEVEYAVMVCPKPDCHPGDVNQDGIIDIGDIVYVINYVFYGGPPPVPDISCGDVNCDGIVDIGDIVFLINYVFYGGPEPPWSC